VRGFARARETETESRSQRHGRSIVPRRRVIASREHRSALSLAPDTRNCASFVAFNAPRVSLNARAQRVLPIRTPKPPGASFTCAEVTGSSAIRTVPAAAAAASFPIAARRSTQPRTVNREISFDSWLSYRTSYGERGRGGGRDSIAQLSPTGEFARTPTRVPVRWCIIARCAMYKHNVQLVLNAINC